MTVYHTSVITTHKHYLACTACVLESNMEASFEACRENTSVIVNLAVNYRKQGKIRWAKLSRFSRFSRALRTFYCEYLFFILHKLRIIALFKCCKRKAPQKLSREKLHWAESAKV